MQNFYDLREDRVCEIEAYGTVFDGDKKSVCDHISIIRELSYEEILSLVNLGINNTGLFNSGNCNSGNHNSGSFCACNNSSGLFMTKKITYEAFNKQLTEKEYRMLLKSEGFSLLQYFKLYSFRARTEKNGKKYLSYLSYKASWRMFWQKLTPKQKLTIKRMPHFDADVFYEITGIKVGQLKTHHKE